MKSPNKVIDPYDNGIEEGEEFCLANAKVFFHAALEHWDYLLQGLIDALFPKKGYHIDATFMEATLLENEITGGKRLDSLCIDRTNGCLFNIEMQLYDLDINRPQEYFNVLRAYADSPNGPSVPIKKIFIIFCCDRDPMKGKGRRLYRQLLGCRTTRSFHDSGFEFVLIDMTSPKHPKRLATIFHDLLCKDPEEMIDPHYAEWLRKYRRNPKQIRRREMTKQEYDAQLKATFEAEKEAAVKKVREEYARGMLDEGMSPQAASRVTGLSPEYIASLPKRS